MPASPSPPCQCPIRDVAKLIIRRATPPWVRKFPARMKNGIAMISKLSMPVNNFIDTASMGTVVSVNRKVSTVRPSAIETGMPVSISAISSAKIMAARKACGMTMTPAFSRRQIIRIKIGAMIKITPSGLVPRLVSLVGSPDSGCSPDTTGTFASRPSTSASLCCGSSPVQ